MRNEGRTLRHSPPSASIAHRGRKRHHRQHGKYFSMHHGHLSFLVGRFLSHIDSEHLNTFDSIDKEWLEKVAEIVPNPFSTY